ncbi:rod-determining factor RdfA [Halorubrum vacuolatum]|uniref:Uncharacterized protein n=1 Tax=Halorubrum vacuolatum TaxID=63740 RepID=A0A238XH51_HALVU|nr:rod-determining factor RdfA [Halorubrum vacuolatum]SNR57823.1 hypothetical protein SAMN06264855_11752 [Halorubrum vacuolatum]
MKRENGNQNSNSIKEDKPKNKVAKLLLEYEIEKSFGDKLVELWTANHENRESLRSLEDRFNKRLLEESVNEAGMPVLDGEMSNVYRLLTDEDVSSGKRTEVRNRLEREGINVEQLENDFVTYQAIRSYLKEYRNATYEKTDENRVEKSVETIQRLKSRTTSVVETTFTQLNENGSISIGEFRVIIDINVYCQSCGTQYGAVELLKKKNCECKIK